MAQQEVNLRIEKEKNAFLRQSSLSAKEILESFEFDETVTDVPFRPKGGSLYIVKTTEKTMKDWKADGYSWTNQGTKSLPRKDPKYRKSYFYIKDIHGKPNSGFRKDVYLPVNPKPDQCVCIVHYIGDEELSAPAPYGNTKAQTKMFFRTKPSVVEQITFHLLHDSSVRGPHGRIVIIC